MATRRFLLGVFLAVLAVQVSPAQMPTPPDAQPGREIIPQISPTTMPESASPHSATDTLTAPATLPTATAFPPGTVCSPWAGGMPAGSACDGPVGANGPLTYELYGITGPSLPVAGGDFVGAIRTGWGVGGGARSLWFNPTGDRAWVLDLGLSYYYNPGRSQRIYDVYTPSPADTQTGNPTAPDALHPYSIRGLYRTSFNFALGRDWYLSGPAFLGAAQGQNWRVGAEVGGRWGTAHVDLIPVEDNTSYLRKHDVYHGVFIDVHGDYEREIGTCIVFAGLRAQWGYNWMDLMPPQDGDLQDVNFLMTFGIRY
ncbi:MAG: hypothetical protein LC104_06880 [Bacteroidales bacterium]|nr:hypothetical protein [Bacteroidales bacterium]